YGPSREFTLICVPLESVLCRMGDTFTSRKTVCVNPPDTSMAGIVGVADVLVARALCSGLPQSTTAGHAADPGIADLIVRTDLHSSTDSFTLASRLIRHVD